MPKNIILITLLCLSFQMNITRTDEWSDMINDIGFQVAPIFGGIVAGMGAFIDSRSYLVEHGFMRGPQSMGHNPAVEQAER